jgi:flagellar biosynthesis/type III secretory pathway ATPase
MHQEIELFLQQSIHEKISIEQSLGELSSLFD